jgi:multimeric flavodoxin WrbA
MKKIFGFIGSPHKENSGTYKLAQLLMENLLAKDPEIICDIYTAGMVNINFCRGCWTCVNKGFCPQDKTDDMGMLKEKMLNADFIILGSPNYVMNISGQTKTFFDRLLAWYHLFPLAGKTGVAVMSSGGPRAGLRSPDEAQIYLGAMMIAMGVKYLDLLFATSGVTENLEEEEKVRTASRIIADKVYPYLSGEKKIESDDYLEMTFKQVKQMVLSSPPFMPSKDEWQKKGMLECNTFAELLQVTAKRKKL